MKKVLFLFVFCFSLSSYSDIYVQYEWSGGGGTKSKSQTGAFLHMEFSPWNGANGTPWLTTYSGTSALTGDVSGPIPGDKVFFYLDLGFPISYGETFIDNGGSADIDLNDGTVLHLYYVSRSPPPTGEDRDADGIIDELDPCPDDPLNECNPDDRDGDGIPDDEDDCPDDPTNTCNEPDVCERELTLDGFDTLKHLKEDFGFNMSVSSISPAPISFSVTGKTFVIDFTNNSFVFIHRI